MDSKRYYFKGFDKNFCGINNFVYEVGKTYHSDEVEYGKVGFHVSETPLGALLNHPPTISRYGIVEIGGKIDYDFFSDDLLAATDIKIVAEITLDELLQINEGLNKKEKIAANLVTIVDNLKVTFDSQKVGIRFPECQASDVPYAAVVTREIKSVAKAEADRSVAICTNILSVAKVNCWESVAIATSMKSAAIAEKTPLNLAVAKGMNSVAFARDKGNVAYASNDNWARADIGNAICLTHWGKDGMKIESFVVDGIKYKPDKYYSLVADGSIIERSNSPLE